MINELRSIQFHVVEKCPLDICLDIWVKWTEWDDQSKSHRDRSYDHDEDDTPYIIADIKTAEAVDVIVHGLPRHFQWAVRKRCGIAPTVWRYPNLDYINTVKEAEAILIQKLKNNFACCKYFS